MSDTKQIFDIIIVGAGPAGLSAGIYAGRATLNTLVLEADQVGGQVTTTSVVMNYPAAPQISGTKLMQQMAQQADDFGVTIANDTITGLDLAGDVKVLHGKKQDYRAYSVILATGAKPREVGFPGESEFRGKGIAYCSTCDGELFSGLQVFVVGGGYAAAEEADYLTRYARHVTVLCRADALTCAPLTAAKALNNPKVDIKYHTEVVGVSGQDYLETATFKDTHTGAKTQYKVADGDMTFGMFIYVGTKPATAMFKDQINCNAQGYVLVDAEQKTNVPGVYAAGDVVAKDLRQIITAASDGATAATTAEHYVTALKQKLNIPLHPVKPKPKAAPKDMGQSTQISEASAPEPAHAGAWFSSEIKQQLQPIFARLTDNVTLQLLDDSSTKAQTLLGFAQEFVAMDEHLSLKVTKQYPENVRVPAIQLLNAQGQPTGIQFSGIPSGHELNSLVLAIYNLAGPGQAVDPQLKQRIEQLPQLQIEIGVALTCHFCPDVVAACQHMAVINPKISAEMIDLQEFPAYRKDHHIMSVPATRINDGETIFGSQTLEQLVAACEAQAQVKAEV
ncbi:thioredoxin-disulfide reductase [Agrilactobacillus composti DSM 18527 = JCM 14202]|uniref:Thioredoxin-disulfide reductase n=1 Tax=Agrilactobacillus composti DSM 18527 = JCM 14202 TaxID=1423734 RepID=X0QPQ9_9LACO|nr:FAD-dependent oxidoreductase [Agrilactobacillus composti]KRM32792.1 thioredoxin-disulfide reductase [Agrilactobacillus composti DSM 18527 = JCM 14202]GAF40595.1 alkyl hydroperoxide reductase protein F [Agrilactobacillus composti DSM 18527 = JCM 14202]